MSAIAADKSTEEVLNRIKALETSMEAREKQISKIEKSVAGTAAKLDGAGGAAQGGSRLEENTWFWTAERVRKTYIEYFTKKREHTFWASSPLLPSQDDATLLFVNSGMVQYKPVFVGRIPKDHPFENMKRAANSQKCIRAGGKHNDLEDVGRDNYHHTYFEMLGNWSFGDYFKEEAICWAWDLLTNVFGLPRDRLYATYFEGSEELNLPPDLEAKNFWLKFLPESHVLPGNMKDNFWEMGETGPCGPCSELHFDRIGGRSVPELVNMDDPNVLEIWNLVFMQFFRNPDKSITKLPACHVDTGMGFERIVSVLQNKTSNYDTDVFSPLFEAVYQMRVAEWKKQGQKWKEPERYGGRMPPGVSAPEGLSEDTDGVDTAYRVIVDHIRTLTFAITDKITPSNAGRGYVIRRILRRGVRYGKQFLQLPDRFFSDLVEVVVKTYGTAFPELAAEGNQDRVQNIMRSEEDDFLKTWSNGEKKFKSIVAALRSKGKKIIPGEDVARLYQQNGFPADLTRIMAEDEGFDVDEEGFELAQKKHQEASKGDVSQSKEKIIVLEAAETKVLESKSVDPTDDSPKYAEPNGTAFDGATVKAIFDGSEFLEEAGSGAIVGIILDTTPFYAEQGGQVSDLGSIGPLAISQCRKYGPYVLHQGTVGEGKIAVGERVSCTVDAEYRRSIVPNHTMTHVMNLGLREVCGRNTDQKGSLCNAEKLRFDFNFDPTKKFTTENIGKVESIVREQIAQDLPVDTKVVPLAQAMSISTLRAVFGETYPDPVRVVSVGKSIDELLADPTNPEWMKYSVELCGGTHLKSTSQAGSFVIIEEGGVAKGIRRITALTGTKAAEAIENGKAFQKRLDAAADIPDAELEKEERSLAAALKSGLVCSVVEKAAFAKALKVITKRVVGYKTKLKKEGAKKALEEGKKLAEEANSGSKQFAVKLFDFVIDGKAGKKMVTEMAKIAPGCAFAILSCDPAKGKTNCYISVGKDALAKVKAGDWAKAIIAKVGAGKGGGRPDFANASFAIDAAEAAAQGAEASANEFFA